jgi:hypothetical protein
MRKAPLERSAVAGLFAGENRKVKEIRQFPVR